MIRGTLEYVGPSEAASQCRNSNHHSRLNVLVETSGTLSSNSVWLQLLPFMPDLRPLWGDANHGSLELRHSFNASQAPV